MGHLWDTIVDWRVLLLTDGTLLLTNRILYNLTDGMILVADGILLVTGGVLLFVTKGLKSAVLVIET